MDGFTDQELNVANDTYKASSAPTTEAPPASASSTPGNSTVPHAPESGQSAAAEVIRPARKRRTAQEELFWRRVVDEWRALIEAAKQSGRLYPSIRVFCQERDLREASFYWWRREYAIRDGVPLPTKRSPDSSRIASHLGSHSPGKTTPPSFVQLRVKPTPPSAPASSALCEVVVGRIVVRVASGFDSAELARLLTVLTAC